MSAPRPALILNVSPDPAGRQALSQMLRQAGFGVREAATPAEALQAASEKPALLLLDIERPGMGGWELARPLRQRADGKQPLTIALSGWGREEDRRPPRESGVDLHLPKPADPQYLCHLLRRFGQARGGG